MTAEYPGSESAMIKAGELNVTCLPDRLVFRARLSEGESLLLELCDGAGELKKVKISDSTLHYRHEGYDYSVGISGAAAVTRVERGIRVLAQGGGLELIFG
jgi:hypothetical protein